MTLACIFTIDYEIYGNGEGSLYELVYEPAERLKAIFQKFNTRFVAFVEAAELEIIESEGTDESIHNVISQIRELHTLGFEIGLHLHPQWYNGRRENGKWVLDYSEYNLCTLPLSRITHIVDRSIRYLRKVLNLNDFTPLAFRAGNWLFQPTCDAANALVQCGIRIDSSVFKGGLQHEHKLDYRRALRNGYYWRFLEDVVVPCNEGHLLELPIYTRAVPFWKMLTFKRLSINRRGQASVHACDKKLEGASNYLRFRYPLKFDFCRMTLRELTSLIEEVLEDEQENPTPFRPIVAIGHTKDLLDFETVEAFLCYLAGKCIPISTFEQVFPKCSHPGPLGCSSL